MIQFMENTNGKVIEAFFNIMHQDTRLAFDMAKTKGVHIIAKIPLDSDWLTGKYHEDSVFDGVRGRWTREDIKKRADLVDQLRYLSNDNRTLAQVAINYCLSYEAVSTVIPGANNDKQLEANVEALNHPINKEVIEELEKFYEKEVVLKKLVW